MIDGLCAIIISRGLDEMLRFCLKSFFESARELACPVEAIVVDNASGRPYAASSFSDGRVRLLRFDVHAGFAAACNQAVRSCSTKQLLFLNNDVLLDQTTLAAMIGQQDQAGIGVTGARLYFPDGRIQHRGVVFGRDDIGPYHLDRGHRSLFDGRQRLVRRDRGVR